MFLHLSVILFTGGVRDKGGGRACVAKGGHAWQETATAADDTHPTGIHSCWTSFHHVVTFASFGNGTFDSDIF